jgi:hypothetical protein
VWETIPTQVKRILTLVIFFVITILITVAGTLAPLSSEEITEINQELQKIRESISGASLFSGTTIIFRNNFVLCLIFFIPILGPIFGFIVMYNTGVVIAAESVSAGVHPVLAFLLLFYFPFTWLEFLAYSIALAQSVWLIYSTINHKWKKELVNTCIMITVCAVILLIAAIIEMAIIQAFGATS